jgi:hypothetical protein
MKLVCVENVAAQDFSHRLQQRCDFANPPGENRAIQLDTFASKNLRLTMERRMVAIFCNDHMRK